MWKRLIAVLLAVLLAPLALELVLHLSYDAAETAEEIATQRGAVLAAIPGLEQPEAKKGRIPQPYVGWDERSRFAQIEGDLAYFRSERAERDFEVLVVGGSVSGLIGNLGAEGLRAVQRGSLPADRRLRQHLQLRDCFGGRSRRQRQRLRRLRVRRRRMHRGVVQVRRLGRLPQRRGRSRL
jgi:hypothetical protein